MKNTNMLNQMFHEQTKHLINLQTPIPKELATEIEKIPDGPQLNEMWDAMRYHLEEFLRLGHKATMQLDILASTKLKKIIQELTKKGFDE